MQEGMTKPVIFAGEQCWQNIGVKIRKMSRNEFGDFLNMLRPFSLFLLGIRETSNSFREGIEKLGFLFLKK